LAISLFLTGCLAPPFLFPRTSAHGVVVDQYGNPVPKAELKASWEPYRAVFWDAPIYKEQFHARHDGTWEFSVRKSVALSVEVLPSPGYAGVVSGHDRTTPILNAGECPTNAFVLKLRKIEDPPR
jgi:hypothetical protein